MLIPNRYGRPSGLAIVSFMNQVKEENIKLLAWCLEGKGRESSKQKPLLRGGF